MNEPIVMWLLASTRVVAAVLVAPMIGCRAVPIWVRGAVGASLSLALVAHVFETATPAADDSAARSVDWVAAFGAELALGLMFGMAAALVILAARMVGQIMGQMTGFAWGDMGTGIEEGALPSAQLCGLTALMIYLAVGGPEMLIGALIDSFQSVPVGAPTGTADSGAALAAILQHGFRLALLGIGPFVVAWLIVQGALGLVIRLAPQLGFFQFGFQANLALFWVALILTALGTAWLWEREIVATFERLAAR